MQGKRQKVITGWQLFCLILNGVVGIGIFNLARQVGEVAGRGVLLTIPLAGLLALGTLAGHYLLARRFPRQTLAEYAEKILSPPLGKIYLGLYGVLSLALAITVSRSYWSLVSAWALGRTPQLAFLLPLILVCWNVARRGVVVTARVVELINYGTLTLMLLLMIPVIPVDLDYVRPVMETGGGGILRGIIPSLYATIGFDVFLIVFPYVRSRRPFAAGAAAIALITLFYTITTLLIIGNLGLELVLINTWPLQTYLNRFALAVFERADIVFLIAWVFQIINTVIVLMFTGMSVLQGVVPQKVSRRWLHLSILVLAMAGVAWPVKFASQVKLVNSLSPIASFYHAITPLLLWLIAALRGLKGEKTDVQDQAA